MFQIQSVCFDNIGLLLAAFFNMLFKNNQRFSFFLSSLLIRYSIVNGIMYLPSKTPYMLQLVSYLVILTTLEIKLDIFFPYGRLQATLPFAIYPIFTAVDLLGIYQGLKHIHLQTLTKVVYFCCLKFDSIRNIIFFM